MNKLNLTLIATAFTLFLMSCSSADKSFDASGSFESVETLISSESMGVIKALQLVEGESLEAGQYLGYVDSLQLSLKKQQLEAQIDAILSRKPNISVQMASFQEQLKTAEKEQIRITNLVAANAATTKQLDDVNAQIEVIKRQIAAQRSSLEISTESLKRETQPLRIQIEQLEDQLLKTRIINPIAGTVLTKYAEVNEMTSPGKPIYKIADLSNMILRVYITGEQLPQIKLNQSITVKTDDGKGGMFEDKGIITWISSKAEFTPKTIQTKDERANMVYAVKVAVKNTGRYKIGMYGEVKW